MAQLSMFETEGPITARAHRMILRSGMTITEKAVMHCLADYACRSAKAHPSVETIAVEASVSRRTAQRTLRKLESRGLIRSEVRIRATTLYHIDWVGLEGISWHHTATRNRQESPDQGRTSDALNGEDEGRHRRHSRASQTTGKGAPTSFKGVTMTPEDTKSKTPRVRHQE